MTHAGRAAVHDAEDEGADEPVDGWGFRPVSARKSGESPAERRAFLLRGSRGRARQHAINELRPSCPDEEPGRAPGSRCAGVTALGVDVQYRGLAGAAAWRAPAQLRPLRRLRPPVSLAPGQDDKYSTRP